MKVFVRFIIILTSSNPAATQLATKKKTFREAAFAKGLDPWRIRRVTSRTR
jgi:hypothetical protein